MEEMVSRTDLISEREYGADWQERVIGNNPGVSPEELDRLIDAMKTQAVLIVCAREAVKGRLMIYECDGHLTFGGRR